MAFNLNYYKEATDLTIVEDSSLGIMRWGRNNAFPQTLKTLIQKSGNSNPAVERTATFYMGEIQEIYEELIHPNGVTLFDVIKVCSTELAMFGGFAIHVNYNINGDIVNFRPLNITDLRFNQLDELNYSSKIGYHCDFGRNSPIDRMIPAILTSGSIRWFNRFNPNRETVKEQIKTAGSLSKFGGQVLYYSNTGMSMYPTPPLLPQINYVLSDVENSILVRKETATGFINSYIVKTTLDSEDETLAAFEEALTQAQGARGSGKIITFSGLAPEDVNSTMLEPISGSSGSTTIIDSAQKTYDLDKSAVLSAYLIPPILGGNNSKAVFSSTELKDAYFVFNAITKSDRAILQNKINSILKNSILGVEQISIKKLSLDEEFYNPQGTKEGDPLKTKENE